MSCSQDNVSHKTTNIGDYLHAQCDNIHIPLYTHVGETSRKKKWPRRKWSRSFLLLLFGNSLHYNRLLCIQYQIYGRACAIISAWAVSTRTHRKGTSSNLRAYLHVIDNDELNREYITSLIVCICRCALISLSYSYISLPPLLHRPSVSWFLFLRSNVLHIQQGFIPCSSLMEVQAVANHRLSDEKLDRKRFAHRIRRMLHVANTWEVKKKKRLVFSSELLHLDYGL